VPELTVFSIQADDDRTTYVGGVADALAYLPLGMIELVIDWKTDVAPSAQQIELYRRRSAITSRPQALPRAFLSSLPRVSYSECAQPISPSPTPLRPSAATFTRLCFSRNLSFAHPIARRTDLLNCRARR
jgi:hypothetical protein